MQLQVWGGIFGPMSMPSGGSSGGIANSYYKTASPDDSKAPNIAPNSTGESYVKNGR